MKLLADLFFVNLSALDGFGNVECFIVYIDVSKICHFWVDKQVKELHIFLDSGIN